MTAAAAKVKPSVKTENIPVVEFDEKIVERLIRKALGPIDGLKTVRCVRVADDTFRVNVFCEKPGKSEFILQNYIAHSYFLVLNNGEIVSCKPGEGSKILSFDSCIRDN